MNAETLIDMLCEAALMARHSRTPRLEKNRHERAGRFLLNTCRHTADGEPDSRFAVYETPAGMRFRVLPHYLYDTIHAVECLEETLVDAQGLDSQIVKQ